MKRYHDSRFVFVGAFIAFAFLIIGLNLLAPNDLPFTGEEEEHEAQEEQLIDENLIRRFTDGVFISEEEQPSRLYAVMIENSAEAWPLQGLADAHLVFEAPVEGSIPRFMALYDDKQAIEEIGPVRSARPYYVDWVYGLNALYAHVGGSPEALTLLRQLPVKDLNEFFWGQFFWRSQKRFAPHNVYTSIKELTNAYDEREFAEQNLESLFVYKDDANEDERGEETMITIPFSPISSRYDAGWEYEQETNSYLRYQGKEEQKEKDGDSIYASNIIVLFSDISVIDDVGRRRIRTIGTGDALLFQDGKQFSIIWDKEDRSSPLQFRFEEGEVIELNAGATWIEVVQEGADIVNEPRISEES